MESSSPPVWQAWVVGVTLAVMFLFMMKDWVGPDWVMVTGLMIFLVTEIVDAKEALVGFSNEGILTVLSLLVMADGISRTGLLDYYLGLALGKPRTVVGAQLRLMIPIATLSAFLNNTPIVAVAIPFVLRWAKLIQVPRQQLLIPLSYATILGGTCTLVGTSTNLVVNGKLKEEYPDDDAGTIGLFDLGIYGVPNALFGIIYMLCCGSFLLPNGRSQTSGGGGGGETSSGGSPAADADDLLLGARVMPWSPSAGRTVKRSGLGDSGGIYLANVKRYATGNVQYAVSRDFVLSVGDELYFTGRVDQFSDFCQSHGLAIITTDQWHHHYTTNVNQGNSINTNNVTAPAVAGASARDGQVGVSRVSTFQSDEAERLRLVNRLMDQIEDRVPYENETKSTRVIVTRDYAHTATDVDDCESVAVIVAVDTIDRPGLMVKISDTLFEQGLQVRHSEAKVVQDRSLSIWRCTAIDNKNKNKNARGRYDFFFYEALWEAVYRQVGSNDHPTLLLHGDGNDDGGDDDDDGDDDDALATKRSGTKVIRAAVTKSSSLIGKKASEVHFRKAYKAAIVAYQKNGKNTSIDVAFDEGDVLVLNAFEGSPLLNKPPPEFYAPKSKPFSAAVTSMLSLSNHGDDNSQDNNGNLHATDLSAAWKDLKVTFPSDDPNHEPSEMQAVGEFLTAFVIAETFPIKGRSVVSLGFVRLPGVVLVSVERPIKARGEEETKVPVSFDDKVEYGDILWYAGSAEAIGDLKRVHGLTLYQELTIRKATKSLQDRRLVQAVIARSSPWSVCPSRRHDSARNTAASSLPSSVAAIVSLNIPAR
jgi:Trk K+ transport system NAD-binding subunit